MSSGPKAFGARHARHGGAWNVASRKPPGGEGVKKRKPGVRARTRELVGDVSPRTKKKSRSYYFRCRCANRRQATMSDESESESDMDDLQDSEVS
jgi:hypothetical protein